MGYASFIVDKEATCATSESALFFQVEEKVVVDTAAHGVVSNAGCDTVIYNRNIY